jgi:ParB family chromosome partitioning protein
LGITQIPAVILPKFAKDYIIALNTEKGPTLRDKAHQAFEIFQTYKNIQPDETEANIMFDRVDEPYYITVGFVLDYFKDEKFPGYAFERVLKKIDNFLDLPMKEAEQERINRAKKLIEVKEVLNQKYEQLGLKNALQKETIVSKAWQNIY